MKKQILLSLLFFALLISSKAQQINSARIGKQVWMLSNLNKEVPGSWNYNDDPDLGKKYGRLYTYEAAKNVCPIDWRLPTAKDWDELINALGGEDKAAPMLMRNTNDGGFNAKLGGVATVGNYKLLDNYGAYWTATENDKDNAWFLYFTPKSTIVTSTFSVKSHGLSVRCIKKSEQK